MKKDAIHMGSNFYAPLKSSKKGDPGFTVIFDNNEPLNLPRKEMTSGVLYYNHIYRTTFQINGLPTPRGLHACLLGDHWCWSNAWENPKMAARYIIWKIRHILPLDK